MTCTELYQLINNPVVLSEKTLPDLRQIVIDFPYFHAARMLYLKNMAVTDDIRLKVDLKKMAIHIPDRMKLFILLEGDNLYTRQTKPTKSKSLEKGEAFNLVENFLSKTETLENKSTDKSLVFDSSSSADYINNFLTDNHESEKTDTKLQHQELIDSFIEKEEERPGNRIIIEPLAEEREDNTLSDNLDKLDKEPLDSSYFTETLAHVYIKQKRFDKALEIIKNLSLKYPEKNIYFADQIRFLEKLIIHTK